MNRALASAALSALAIAALAFAAAAPAQARDQINIVGSSTVYPFTSYVAEEFGKTTRHPTPKVEQTGSGSGHKLFGKGTGPATPDLVNSSRRMKVSEFDNATSAGITGMTEAVIGYDGIAIAESVENPGFNITKLQLHLAIAAKVPGPDGTLIENPYKKWSDIDASLPDRPIVIYGPPTTSGTRDAFEELILEKVSETLPEYDGEAFTDVRQDGAYVDAGENDNLIINRVTTNTQAIGIFGYGFLDENRDKVRASSIDGVPATPETISSGEYPVSRSLYFYIKHDHIGVTPGLYDFVQLFMSEKMIGPAGQLKNIGLIPLPEDLRLASRQRVLDLVPLELVDGKLPSLQDYLDANGPVAAAQ
ncbi:MAG: substrate-binding domain-containing protein [Planctomycetota bacterium]